MKFDLEKINNFFDNEKIDQDIKDFVIKFYNVLFQNDLTDDIFKFFLMDLGFYEMTKEDENEIDTKDEDYMVFDFFKLSKVNPSFRKIILERLYKNLKNGDFSEFFNEFLDESKLILQYEKWKKIRRKNKLKVLNDLNINELNK